VSSVKVRVVKISVVLAELGEVLEKCTINDPQIYKQSLSARKPDRIELCQTNLSENNGRFRNRRLIGSPTYLRPAFPFVSESLCGHKLDTQV